MVNSTKSVQIQTTPTPLSLTLHQSLPHTLLSLYSLCLSLALHQSSPHTHFFFLFVLSVCLSHSTNHHLTHFIFLFVPSVSHTPPIIASHTFLPLCSLRLSLTLHQSSPHTHFFLFVLSVCLSHSTNHRLTQFFFLFVLSVCLPHSTNHRLTHTLSSSLFSLSLTLHQSSPHTHFIFLFVPSVSHTPPIIASHTFLPLCSLRLSLTLHQSSPHTHFFLFVLSVCLSHSTNHCLTHISSSLFSPSVSHTPPIIASHTFLPLCSLRLSLTLHQSSPHTHFFFFVSAFCLSHSTNHRLTHTSSSSLSPSWSSQDHCIGETCAFVTM